MAKRNITKSEKRSIMILLAGFVLFSFLDEPITTFVSNLLPGLPERFLAGLALVFLIAYFGRLNRVI